MTIDVEDWYDGMAVLGQPMTRPHHTTSGLAGLTEVLDSAGRSSAVTMFVVGNYAEAVHDELAGLAARGHEIASHGPDHGRLPDDPPALLEWLRRGRTMLEDSIQVPVCGFRSPRFDVPAGPGLARYRDLLAEAGYEYVSDTNILGGSSPVHELPVLTRHRLPIGGGSYQRLVPVALTASVLERATGAAVLYYHSYDFGATLPSTSSIRSLAVAKQLVGRRRVARVFSRILSRYGSEACSRVGR